MKDLEIIEKAMIVADIAMRVSGIAADKMLMDVAESGDEHALEVLMELPHHVKVKMVRENDFTIPSFTGLLSKPRDVVDIMVADPSIWRNITLDDMEDRLSDICVMCTSLILSHSTYEWFEAIFQAISDSDDALLYLATIFIGCVEENEENEFIFSFANSQTGDGEISHIYEKMHEFAPKLEQHIAEIVCNDGNSEERMHNRLFAQLVELHHRANVSAVADTEVASEMEDL